MNSDSTCTGPPLLAAVRNRSYWAAAQGRRHWVVPAPARLRTGFLSQRYYDV